MLDKAMRQKQKRKAAGAAKRAHDMDDCIEIHAPEDGLPPSSRERTGHLGRRTRRRERKQPPRPCLRLRRQSLPTGLPGPVTRSRRQFHPVFLWWEDLGPTAPSGTKGSERHRSHSGEWGRRDRSHGPERRHDSPRSRHSPMRRESGERTRPTSLSGGSSSRSKQAGSADLSGSGHASGRATDVRPSSTHHQHQHRSRFSSSRASVDRGSESRHHGRRESVDKDKSGSSHVSKRDVELSPVIPQPPERRTITVIQSPPRPAGRDDSAGVTGPTDLAGVTSPADSAADHDSVGDEPAGDHDSAGDEPAVVEDSAGVADPAHEEDLAGVADSADQQD